MPNHHVVEVAGRILATLSEPVVVADVAVYVDSDPAAVAARDQTWVQRGLAFRRREAIRLVEPRLESEAG